MEEGPSLRAPLIKNDREVSKRVRGGRGGSDSNLSDESGNETATYAILPSSSSSSSSLASSSHQQDEVASEKRRNTDLAFRSVGGGNDTSVAIDKAHDDDDEDDEPPLSTCRLILICLPVIAVQVCLILLRLSLLSSL
jgi:hypothetical protein